MPFESEKQRRYMHANHPEIAKKWTNKYGRRAATGKIMVKENKKKKKFIPDYLKKKIKGTTIGGGFNIGDDEWATTPSGSLKLGKGNKTANISISKPFSKVDKSNINSTIGLDFTKEGKNSSLTIGGSKTGKSKNFGISLTKTFTKGGGADMGKHSLSGRDVKMLGKKGTEKLMEARGDEKLRNTIKNTIKKAKEFRSKFRRDQAARPIHPLTKRMGGGMMRRYTKGTKKVIDLGTPEGEAHLRKHNPGLTYESRYLPPWTIIPKKKPKYKAEPYTPGKKKPKYKAEPYIPGKNKGKYKKLNKNTGGFISISEYVEDIV